MRQCIEGIILQNIKYSESSLIIRAYTAEHGLISMIAKGVRSKNSKKPAALFYPFSVIELDFNYQPGKDLHNLYAAKTSHAFKELHTDFNKSALAVFLTEILSLSLAHSDADPRLYHFVRKAIITLDETQKYYGNFHLVFMLKLSEYLGFYPMDNYADKQHNYFYPEEGLFHLNPDPNAPCTTAEEALLLHMLLKAIAEKEHLPLQKKQRGELLVLIIELYKAHIPNFKVLKSLEVFQEVFE